MGKRVFSFLLAVVMLVSAASLTVFAEGTFTLGDYTYTVEGGKAVIVSCLDDGAVINIPHTLGDYTVGGISAGAFTELSVTEVYVPSSCTQIQTGAFGSAVTLYGFADASVKTYASENAHTFVALADTAQYSSYVGKLFKISSTASYTLEALDALCSLSGNYIKCEAKGEAQLALKLANGISGTITVAIKEGAQSITNIPAAINLYIGDVYALHPAISNGVYPNDFTYKTFDTAVAVVKASGVITAKAPGKTNLLISFPGGVYATIPVAVGIKADQFDLDQEDLLLGVGEVNYLTYTLGENQLSKKVVFTSSDPGTVAVSQKGKVLPLKVGTATITATTYEGLSDTCIITVGKAPTKIKLAKSAITLGVGEDVKFKVSVDADAICSSYLWRSGDTSIFTVDDDGVVHAKKVGTAKVYAYTYNYKSKNPYIRAAAVITVKRAPSSVSLNKTNLVLGVGEQFDLNYSLPANTASYKMSVSMENPEIAQNGKAMIITGLQEGTTTFTVTAFNGKKAVCNITVKPAPQKVACKPATVKLSLKQKYQLSPYVNKGAVCSSYIYKTSDKKVCTVNANGLVQVKDYGSCFIYIYAYNHTKNNPIMCKVKCNVGYITNKLASYTTYFDRYYYGKSQNLKMACKYINGKTDGYILQPGETFSFNAVVGARTSARGFTNAKVIQGGTYVDGMGGGICQAATTIFNATLLSNLKITERHYHDLRSSYCPVGRDATVSWGSQDYKFVNNFDTPIRIKMNYNAGGSINCSIYSLKKLKVPKISLPVTRVNGGYKLQRVAKGKVNYTTYSYYSN